MRTRRTALLVAVVMPVVFLGAGGTAAWANAKHVNRVESAAKGTITCTNFTSTVTFTPPLVPGSATSTKETEKAVSSGLAGCTSTPSGGPTSATSLKEKPTKLSSNACSSLEGGTSATSFTVKWPGIPASKATFTGATQTSNGYKLTNGTIKGSYAMSDASGTIELTPASLTAIENCISGKGGDVSSFMISGGSMTL